MAVHNPQYFAYSCGRCVVCGGLPYALLTVALHACGACVPSACRQWLLSSTCADAVSKECGLPERGKFYGTSQQLGERGCCAWLGRERVVGCKLIAAWAVSGVCVCGVALTAPTTSLV